MVEREAASGLWLDRQMLLKELRLHTQVHDGSLRAAPAPATEVDVSEKVHNRQPA